MTPSVRRGLLLPSASSPRGRIEDVGASRRRERRVRLRHPAAGGSIRLFVSVLEQVLRDPPSHVLQMPRRTGRPSTVQTRLVACSVSADISSAVRAVCRLRGVSAQLLMQHPVYLGQFVPADRLGAAAEKLAIDTDDNRTQIRDERHYEGRLLHNYHCTRSCGIQFFLEEPRPSVERLPLSHSPGTAAGPENPVAAPIRSGFRASNKQRAPIPSRPTQFCTSLSPAKSGQI